MKSQNQKSAVNLGAGVTVGGRGNNFANNHNSNPAKSDTMATMPKRPRKTSGGVLAFQSSKQGNAPETVRNFSKMLVYPRM